MISDIEEVISLSQYKYEPSCFRHGALPRLAATYRRLEKAYTPLLHSHPDWLEITYVSSGSGEQIIGERNWHVSKGDLLISNCGVVHGENPLSVSDFKTYCFNFENVHLTGEPENCLVSGSDCPILSSGKYSAEISSLIGMMHSLHGEPGMDDACQLLSASFLALIHQMNLERRPETDEGAVKSSLLTSGVQQYINRNYRMNLTLDGLAGQFHVSRYYLSHVFRKNTGFSLVQYLTQRRIGEAQILLQSSDKSVADIALLVGFSSSSYFNNVFRRYVGMTPVHYRTISRDFARSFEHS